MAQSLASVLLAVAYFVILEELFLGCFASNVEHGSVLEAELLGLILAMEFAASNHWTHLWIECHAKPLA